jgi:signal transduction histidine kinase
VPRRSIGFPLTLGSVLILLVIALAVGWLVLLMSDVGASRLNPGLTSLDWVLLILGTATCGVILIGLFWMCLWLVREMRLNQRQRAFLDAVTHEMRTPLAALRLHVETLERHNLEPDQRREFLNRMDLDLERLHRTVEQVLAAARAEEPRRKAPRGTVALRELLAECSAEIRSRHDLPEKALVLDTQSCGAVQGDAAELALVFRNLLENAVKYSEPRVEVRVAVSEPEDGRVRIEISDRGIGIPAEELRKIFHRFYRVGRDVQRTAAGLGLGLFIVRSLVRRQGGRVEARSAGQGEGSRFLVTLRTAEPAH